MSKNNNGQTPMELDNVNHFKNFKMFAPFQQRQAHFPVESYSIFIVCDNMSVRKSSLAAIIMERANELANHEFDTSECVTVEPLTTGIDAHTFTSHDVGNVILYDFAGHREYYSSHVAVLKNLMLTFPAVFLVLTKLILLCIYRDIASNTGIVPLSVLKEAFPDYDIDMLVGFLKSLQFCHIIESSALGHLETNISTSLHQQFDELLFFPALIDAEPPTDIKNIENGLGWCLWCPDPNEFLSTRFLHMLLLSLTYNYCFPLPPRKTPGKLPKTNPIVERLAHHCSIWTNGIYWENKFKVIVEVSEDNRSVTVLVSNKKMTESHRVFNSVIKNNLSLKNQLCLCTGKEYMIAPNACTLNVHILYSIEDVAVGFLTKLDSKEPNNIHIEDIVGNKGPFFQIAPLVTKALFDPSNAELPVQQDYLQHIENMCGVSFLYTVECTYASIREHCSQFSIFAGCNPLVSYYFFYCTCNNVQVILVLN